METNLAKVLVQRGVIRQGTVLEAIQSAKGLSCVCDSYAESRYVVLGASATDDWVFFQVASSKTERHRVRCDYITGIDGMAIERVAAAHQLHTDGSPIVPTSRRGRTRKTVKQPALLVHEPVEVLPPEITDQTAAADGFAHQEA